MHYIITELNFQCLSRLSGADVPIKVRFVKFASKVPCVRAPGSVRCAVGGQEDNEERQAVREKWR